jgi:hypothetical protein
MDTSNFEVAVQHQARRLNEFSPDVLVGSSFGGAVALALVARGFFRGGVVLLAPAHRQFGVEERIPAKMPVELVEVDDGHRLATLLEGDKLASLVHRVRDLLR